jgi:uncharacterized protein
MRIVSALLIVGVLAMTANAAIITQWNFNSTTPDNSTTTGSLTASIGSGAIGWVGGVTTSGPFVSGSGSTDPAATDNSAYTSAGYPAQGGGNKTAGFEIAVSTAGYTGITITWDQKNSNTASRYYRLQYSADGSTFNDADLITLASSAFESKSVDLSAIPAINENVNFKVRIVSEFAPDGSGQYAPVLSTGAYGTGGTARLDMLTINGNAVPEPMTLAMLGLAGLACLGRRRG